jgi:hypothetical protein
MWGIAAVLSSFTDNVNPLKNAQGKRVSDALSDKNTSAQLKEVINLVYGGRNDASFPLFDVKATMQGANEVRKKVEAVTNPHNAAQKGGGTRFNTFRVKVCTLNAKLSYYY